MERLSAPERTREELRALMNGDLGTAAGRSDLVRVALRLIVDEVLEGEMADVLGRERYDRGDGEKAGYRNGYRLGKVKTAEGAVDYSAPQVRDTPEPFVSGVRAALSGRTRELERLAVELYAPGGIGEDGRKSLLGLMAGSKEDVETVRAFFQDLRARGLGDPLLVVSDGRRGSSGRSRNASPDRRASVASRTGCAISRPRSRRIRGRNSRPGSQPAIRRPAGDCAPTGDRHPRRLRQRPAERARLLRR